MVSRGRLLTADEVDEPIDEPIDESNGMKRTATYALVVVVCLAVAGHILQGLEKLW